MPRGVHTSKKPPGNKQRKVKKQKKKYAESIAGSMLQYVKIPGDGQGSSKDIECQSPVDKDDSSDASMHSSEAQALDMAEFEIREEGLETEFVEVEEMSESISDSDHSVNNDLEKDIKNLSDAYFWEIPVLDSIRVEIIKKGSNYYQNKDGPFAVVKREDAKSKGANRQLTKDCFYMVMPNGDKMLRSWMVYSLVGKQLHCFSCRLFTTTVSNLTSKLMTGFKDWWKMNPKVRDHEKSEDHLSHFEKWKLLDTRLRLNKTIDSETISLMESKKKKWRDYLYRLLDITLYLAKQNLPFRGHREHDSTSNKGNFLEMVEMLSKYDPVLKEHLMDIKWGTINLKGSVSYLGKDTQNDFITLMANRVKEKLIIEIKTAKYFGIMFDSTPDISHIDQMSEVIRYVKIYDRKVEVKEVFLGFFPLQGAKAEKLTEDILVQVDSDGLDIMLCRGQGYDNCYTMSGIYGGVQAIIKRKNNKAIFNGCVDHTLNLCGQHSFAGNTSCITFFGTLERLYTFFALSTHRWEVLISCTGVEVKRLSTTRWSAHHDAVKPVKEHFDEFVEAIKALCDPSENLKTRGEAELILPAILKFSFLCYLYLWGDILSEVNHAQKYLQIKGLPLDKVVTKLEALRIYLDEERNHLVENSIQQALDKSVEYDIEIERRVRYKKMMPGEQARDAGLTLKEETKTQMLECIDRFHTELQTRLKAIKEVAAMFESVQTKSILSAILEELNISIPNMTLFLMKYLMMNFY